MSQKTRKKLDSMLVKGILVAVLTLLLLIPINLVMSLIEERADIKLSVVEEITSKWGGEQSVMGPVLMIPYVNHTTYKTKTEDNAEQQVVKENVEYIYLLPDTYNIESDSKVEERSRSIYNTLVYQSLNKISGSFNYSKIDELKINSKDILWEESLIILGISHMQGIKNKIILNINNKEYEATPGIPYNTLMKSGLTIMYPIVANENNQNIDFNFELNLNGSEKLQIAPIGKENNIKMKSDWNTVAFSGDFLPTKRDIKDEGFEAEWNIFDYNRNYLQMWIGKNYSEVPEVGIDLRYSVDQYQMSMRSVKYAIMFIALTFVIFFFVEIITKKRIHPVQYTLVSLALILFYTLLVALSEHINFHIAYLVSSIAIVTMITLYVKSIFGNWIHTLAMGGFIAIVYIYLYVILQLEDMSLLIGAVGLFIALAAIMYASRKIDWYKKDNEDITNSNPHN